MKKITSITLMLFTALSYAQVGINTNTPDASSALEIESTTGGILIPRLSEAQRDAITSPATGLMIYQTNQILGFYFYDGIIWTKIAGPAGPAGADGAQGLQGDTGPDGPTGSTGSAGPQGIAGADGAQGLQGLQGDIGPAGPTGATGSVGPQGIAGADGAQGLQGLQGDTGPTGSTGSVGPQGIAGADGAQGLQGLQGMAGGGGADGSNGIDGFSAYEIWIADGNNGTESDFLASLVGPEGPLVSGTNGQTLYNNGNEWVSTSNLFNDGSSVSIGNNNIDPSAVLQIESTTQGVLFPKMSSEQRDLIATPQIGLLIFQIDNSPGFYFYDGTAWVALDTSNGSSSGGSDSKTLIYTTNGF